jgi:hypothetical protein
MGKQENVKEHELWNGEERREVKRRHAVDRRLQERKKRYLWSIIFPVTIGIIGTAILSWGAYVTHVTYGISASYEETFKGHIQGQLVKEAEIAHKFELNKLEYTDKLTELRRDMNLGFKEMRNTQKNIYNLLIGQSSENTHE